ncbi:MAG TPA: hypothetical protein VGU44_04905, partial [Gammaproteobacteria bacterium]|nr:hypothetical protein [Gammaproteobacteria bacterium]
MLDATEALGKIFLVIKLIYTQVQLVKENNEQCNHLVEKIRVIESSVQGLDKIKNKEQYKVGLNDLLGLLQESLDILKNFSDSSFLQQFFLKTGSYQEDFKDLNKKLDSSASQLTFSIVAQLRVNRELKETEEVLPASLPPSIAQVIKSVYKVRPGDLTQFLKLVAEGEQDKAEAMLKKNSELALVPGDLIDLSKRTFIGITAFQYSVWALDWHTWTMIRKYLPDEAAQEQAREFETGAWVKTHGIHANLNILIQAYQTTTDLYNAKKYTEGNTAWVQQVGGAQFLLPTHVINEYCHPTRPFYPLPNFKDSLVLSRSRTIDAGEWFTATYNDGKLGEKFACYRGAGGLVWADCRGPVDGVWAYVRDRDSLCALTSTRTVQREELI